MNGLLATMGLGKMICCCIQAPHPRRGAGAGVDVGDTYAFNHADYRCELFRNVYLAWCGSVQLPEGHPDFHAKLSALGQIKVHGGLSDRNFDGVSRPGCFMFDCNHTQTDLIPYSAFSQQNNDRRQIGQLAPAASQPSVTAKQSGGRLLGLPTGGGLLGVPVGSFSARKCSYKDYHFARAELTKLSEQFRSRA